MVCYCLYKFGRDTYASILYSFLGMQEFYANHRYFTPIISLVIFILLDDFLREFWTSNVPVPSHDDNAQGL
jgi:hypothetical protein